MNHPYLVIYSPTSSSAAEHAQKALDAKAAAGLCPLCHDPFEVGLMSLLIHYIWSAWLRANATSRFAITNDTASVCGCPSLDSRHCT